MISRILSRPGTLKSPMLNHKNSKLNPTEGKVRENKNRGAFILYLYSFCFSPRWRFVLQTEISGKYNSPFDFVSIFVSFPYISFSHSSFFKDPVYCFIWYVTIAILTLTSPIDINAPTRDPLVLVTKDSFVSLVTNLNKKSNVCTVANRTDMKKYWAQYELEHFSKEIMKVTKTTAIQIQWFWFCQTNWMTVSLTGRLSQKFLQIVCTGYMF